MKKSKILGIALAAAMITSAASMTAFAKMTDSADIKGLSVGITGSFNNWGNGGEADVVMADQGDGTYVGVIEIDEVTDAMVGEAQTDPGTGTKVPRGFKGITFKVRTNGNWDNSWGDFEEAYNRTYNSQTDCAVEAAAGESLKITVTLDTNKIADQTNIDVDDRYEAGAYDAFNVWLVSYTVEKGAPAEESSEEPAAESSEEPSVAEESEEPSVAEESTESKTEESTTPASQTEEDSKTVGTGDTTSAIALVAVVIASLGVAVAMTKKASSKE